MNLTNCSLENHNTAVKNAIAHSLSNQSIGKVCQVFKALGEPSRLKIVLALLEGEMCVYHISSSTDLKQSLTSHQLRILKTSGIIKSRREGQLMLYKIADEHIKTIIQMSLKHLNCL